MALTALILAGGMSRRMGQDKALLTIHGHSMLRRTWDIASTLTPTVRVMTSRPDRYRALLPATAEWILEEPPSPHAAPPGPLVAFAQGLTDIQTDWVLLLPCDLPALRADVLQRWHLDLFTVRPDAIAYLPRHAKGWEPLCGFYRSSCLPRLQAYVAAGGRSFQLWLDQEAVQAIASVPPMMLENCNTPADWARYRDRIASRATNAITIEPF